MSGAYVSQPGPSGLNNIQRSKEEDAEPPYPGAACVICLNQELTDPTILDCCQHIFCYDCINQWLLTNPSCPMCKKHLNKIKHGLHPVPTTFPVPYNSVHGSEKTVEDLLSDYEMGFLREQGHSPMITERRCIDDRLEQLYHRTLRLRNLAEEADITSQEIEQKRAALNEEIKNLTLLKTMIQNKVKRNVIFNTPTFRRLIYNANLAPRPRLAPRFPADASPNSIMVNEALFRRRLIPFLIRELAAIIERSTIDMSRYLDLVMAYLKAFNRCDKNTIINKLQNGGIPHPIHLLNNVTQFLSSGQRMEVFDENCEFRVRGSDIRGFIHAADNDDIEFLNETITIGGGNGGTRHFRAMDGWAENMRRDYYSTVANNPPAPLSPPPLIVLDDMQNNEPDIADFFQPRVRRRRSNASFRFPVGPSDSDVEFLNETIAFGGNFRPRSMGPFNSSRRHFMNFGNTPSSPIPPQVITLDDMQNNDSDVEVVSPSSTLSSGSSGNNNPAPKRPRLNTPDLH